MTEKLTEVDEQTAHELADQARANVTLDEFFTRNKKPMHREDYIPVIAALRLKRAMFQATDGRKKKEE